MLLLNGAPVRRYSCAAAFFFWLALTTCDDNERRKTNRADTHRYCVGVLATVAFTYRSGVVKDRNNVSSSRITMIHRCFTNIGLFFPLLILAHLLLKHKEAATVNALSLDASRNIDIRRQPVGRVAKLDRSKGDRKSDLLFYARPNLVTHTDQSFLVKLTQLYDTLIPEDGVVLDIMSSHVSHLPPSKRLSRVDVHGMNLEELESNQARIETNGSSFVRNLNDNPSFVGLLRTCEYDAVTCCVGVQYLEEAEAVFAEVGRILKPGGICIVSFTNRFFYQKALVGWIERGMAERGRLVADYFRAAGGFEPAVVEGDGTSALTQLLSIGGIGGDPFVAVVVKREG